MSYSRFKVSKRARARYYALYGGKDALTGEPLREGWHRGHILGVAEAKENGYSERFLETSANCIPMNVETNSKIGKYPAYTFYEPDDPRYREAVIEHDALIEIAEVAKRIESMWLVFDWPDLSQYPELKTPVRDKMNGLPPRFYPVLENCFKETVGADYDIDIKNFAIDELKNHRAHEYQIASIHQLIRRWSDSKTDKGEIIVSPTGSGKTAMGILAIRSVMSANPKARVVILVNRTELLDQWCDRLDRAGFKDYSVLGGGHNFVSKSNGLTLAMSQTIRTSFEENTLRIEKTPHFAIVDEVHQMHWQYFMSAWQKHGTKVLGLTATPHRWELRRYFNNPLINGAMIDDLRMNGVILDCALFVPGSSKILYESVVVDSVGQNNDEQEIDHVEYRNEVTKVIPQTIRDFETSNGREFIGIVISSSQPHARKIAEHLCNVKGDGYAKPFLADEGIEKELDDILRNRCKTKVAVVVNRFREGYDKDALENIIIARTGLKKYQLVQIRGRVVRPWNESREKQPRILDLGFNIERLNKWVAQSAKFRDVYEMLDYQSNALPEIPTGTEYGSEFPRQNDQPIDDVKKERKVSLDGKMVELVRSVKQLEMYRLNEREKMVKCVQETRWQITSRTLEVFSSRFNQTYSNKMDFATRLYSLIDDPRLQSRTRERLMAICQKHMADDNKGIPAGKKSTQTELVGIDSGDLL